jgi:hypothetical protein
MLPTLPRLVPLALPALALLLAGTAAAQTSPWYVGASQTITHESNLYRLTDSAAVPAGVSKSDTIYSTALLGGLDLPVSRQRLYGTATLRASRFQDNDVLDNDGYTLRAGIDWATINRLSGNVDLSANRNLARFNSDTEIGLLTRQNIENNQRLAATVRLGVVTQYTAEASLEHQRTDYSAAEYNSRENRRTTGTLGLRWRPGGSNVFGAGLRHTDGEYPRSTPLAGGGFAADNYTRTGLDLIANVEVGGASRIDTRLTLGRTRYDLADQRDTSGVTGFVAWIWRPGAKLQLDTRLTRDTGQDSYFSGSPLVDGAVDTSRTTTALRLRADYAATAKIRVNAGLSFAQRDLVRTLPPNAFFPVSARGDDDTTELTLGATWEPTRSVVVGCDVGHEKRSVDGTLSLPYSANRLGCYAQVFLR